MRKKTLYLISFSLALIFILIITLVYFLPGYKKGGTKAAFFVYDSSDTFIAEMMEYMTAKLPETMSFVVHYAGNSQSVQNQQIVESIGEGFDLFIINAVDRLACSSIVEKCTGKGIPIIFFNREPLEDALSGNNVFYVGAAADSLGEKQADMVAELFTEDFAGGKYDKNNDGSVQLVILKGEHGHQDAEKRTENCVNRLKELGFELDVMATYVADWRKRDAYEAMRVLHAQHGDSIELVFANNDDMALGAIDYMLDAGEFSAGSGAYDQPFVIVGVDGTAVGLDAIEKGLMYGTVQNDITKQSDAILSLTEYIVNGHDINGFQYTIANGHYIYVDGDIITRENLADYLTGAE